MFMRTIDGIDYVDADAIIHIHKSSDMSVELPNRFGVDVMINNSSRIFCLARNVSETEADALIHKIESHKDRVVI